MFAGRVHKWYAADKAARWTRLDDRPGGGPKPDLALRHSWEGRDHKHQVWVISECLNAFTDPGILLLPGDDHV